jgi:hypothetical protein
MYSKDPPEPPALDEPITISASSARSLTVEKVIHVPCMPDYPSTSENGIAYVIKTEGMPTDVRDGQVELVIHF